MNMEFAFLGTQEIIVVMVIALLVFGPQKLPEIGKQVGGALRELNKMRSDVTRAFDLDGLHGGDHYDSYRYEPDPAPLPPYGPTYPASDDFHDAEHHVQDDGGYNNDDPGARAYHVPDTIAEQHLVSTNSGYPELASVMAGQTTVGLQEPASVAVTTNAGLNHELNQDISAQVVTPSPFAPTHSGAATAAHTTESDKE